MVDVTSRTSLETYIRWNKNTTIDSTQLHQTYIKNEDFLQNPTKNTWKYALHALKDVSVSKSIYNDQYYQLPITKPAYMLVTYLFQVTNLIHISSSKPISHVIWHNPSVLFCVIMDVKDEINKIALDAN